MREAVLPPPQCIVFLVTPIQRQATLLHAPPSCPTPPPSSTYEACRGPCDTYLLPLPPPPTPRTAGSPPPCASGSPSPSTSFSGGGGETGRRRSPGAAQNGTSAADSPLPLPAVPSAGPLKRLRLELAVDPAEAIAAAVVAGVVGGGGEEGNREAGHAQEQGGQAVEQGQALEQEEQARSGSRSGCALPLRKLAPLLPTGLEVLDVWSCNAPPPPLPPPPPPLPPISKSMSVAQGVASEGTGGASQESPRKGRWQFGSGGGDGGGGGSAGGVWLPAASGDREEAPAFDGAGSRRVWGRRQRAGASGEGDSAAVCSAGTGVEVAAAPGDLISIAQACPALRELVIRGDPTQKSPAVPFGVR